MADFPDYKTILINIDKHLATVKLNRPDVHNAFNNELIADLTDAFTKLQDFDDIRVIVLTGEGKSFCAGADLNWMKSVVDYSFDENYEESYKLAKLMHLIFTHPKPVIARVNGAAIGGGVGLMSVCDILVASERAKFGLSEVRLGLVPAAISPYVISRIGESNARELFVTGERISAKYAREIGLVNKVVTHESLDSAVRGYTDLIKNNGPQAVKTVKNMIYKVIHELDNEEIMEYTAKLIANLRISDEGQEGMNAFLEKRKPNWTK